MQPSPFAPHEAANALIHVMLMNEKAVPIVAGMLKSDALLPKQRTLFDAIVAIHGEGVPPDLVTLCAKLKQTGKLDEVGGPYAISQLLDGPSVFGRDNIVAYCRLVNDEYAISQGQKLMGQALEEASGPVSAQDLADSIRVKSATISTLAAHAEPPMTMSDAIAGMQERRGGVSTGFPKVDGFTKGFAPGQLITLGSRMGVGKSAMAIAIGVHVARAHGPVLIASLEMSPQEIVVRAAALFGPTCRAIEGGRESPGVAAALDELHAIPFDILYGPQTIAQIQAKALTAARQDPYRLIIIDYLQLVRAEYHKNETRQQVLDRVARDTKLLAIEMNVPILTTAQLNRGVEERRGKIAMPQLSDLRESDALGMNSDIVLFLHRNYLSPTAQRAVMLIAKNRTGQDNRMVKLVYDREHVTYFESDWYGRLEDEEEGSVEAAGG